MNDILVITNRADDALVIDFAYQFAAQNKKNLIIARAYHQSTTEIVRRQLTMGYGQDDEAAVISTTGESFNQWSATSTDFEPWLRKINISDLTEHELADYIRRENCLLVICRAAGSNLNLQAVINQIDCPLMLLPEHLTCDKVKRMVYLTDLRYCQQHVMSSLTKFRQSSLLLAHICEQGLPDLHPAYGDQLFTDTTSRFTSRASLYFSQIKETNLERVVDTLVHAMNADLLVCVNRKFHFQQLVGQEISEHLPEYITVPVLVYPY